MTFARARTAIVCAAALAIAFASLAVPEAVRADDAPAVARTIDLPTALQLAGARNLDIQIARERLRLAEAGQQSARARFFPWLAAGAAYNRHSGRIQNVEGEVIDVDKQSYSGGAGVHLQLDVGATYFAALSAHQLVRAAASGIDAERNDTILSAANAYLDLLAAAVSLGVRQEAERISRTYQDELHRAVGVGVAFRGDELRVRVLTEQSRIAVLEAEDQRRVAAARLSDLLHLDASVDLHPRDGDLATLTLVDADEPLESLVARAVASRPELQQAAAAVAAAREAKDAAVYGPLIPSIGALASIGGIGGSPDGRPDHGGASQDYAAGINWRIGPGGLLDPAPINAARARLRTEELIEQRQKDRIVREVVEAQSRVRSLAGQLEASRRLLSDSEEGFRLSRERKDFQVGMVLETVQAEEDLVRARENGLRTIVEWNKAQYALDHAIGGPGPR